VHREPCPDEAGRAASPAAGPSDPGSPCTAGSSRPPSTGRQTKRPKFALRSPVQARRHQVMRNSIGGGHDPAELRPAKTGQRRGQLAHRVDESLALQRQALCRFAPRSSAACSEVALSCASWLLGGLVRRRSGLCGRQDAQDAQDASRNHNGDAACCSVLSASPSSPRVAAAGSHERSRGADLPARVTPRRHGRACSRAAEEPHSHQHRHGRCAVVGPNHRPGVALISQRLAASHPACTPPDPI